MCSVLSASIGVHRRPFPKWVRFFEQPFRQPAHSSAAITKMASFLRISKTLPPVYPILDTGTLERLGLNPLEAAEGILEGGAQILQFRHKTFWTQFAFDQAKQI